MRTPGQLINESLTKLVFFVQKELRAELARQDHNATGALSESISGERVKTIDGTRLEIVMEPYGVILNTGRKPGKFVPIQALIQWVKQRAIATGDKEAEKIAWAMNVAIMKEGIPTKGSKARGKRTGWIDDTMERIAPEVEAILADGAELEIINDFNGLVERWR